MQHDNYALGFYTIEMLRRALKDLCEKQIVKKTVIEGKAYFSLLKEDDNGLTNL